MPLPPTCSILSTCGGIPCAPLPMPNPSACTQDGARRRKGIGGLERGKHILATSRWSETVFSARWMRPAWRSHRRLLKMGQGSSSPVWSPRSTRDSWVDAARRALRQHRSVRHRHSAAFLILHSLELAQRSRCSSMRLWDPAVATPLPEYVRVAGSDMRIGSHAKRLGQMPEGFSELFI